jgi:hypothetical protein
MLTEQQLAMSRAITDCIHLRRPFSLITVNVRGTYNEVPASRVVFLPGSEI